MSESLPEPLPETFPAGEIPALRQVMRPRDTNALGTIFGGVILSGIDQAAGIEAHRHHQGQIVTVAMDKVEFKQPVWVGDVVSYFVRTVRVGRTSVTVDVQVWSQRKFGAGAQVAVTEAQVVMVAVDDDFRPTPLASE